MNFQLFSILVHFTGCCYLHHFSDLFPKLSAPLSGMHTYSKDVRRTLSLLSSPLVPIDHCWSRDWFVNSVTFLEGATEPWFSVGTGHWKPHLSMEWGLPRTELPKQRSVCSHQTHEECHYYFFPLVIISVSRHKQHGDALAGNRIPLAEGWSGFRSAKHPRELRRD